LFTNIKAQDFEHHLSAHLEAGPNIYARDLNSFNSHFKTTFSVPLRLQYHIKWKFLQAGISLIELYRYDQFKDSSFFAPMNYMPFIEKISSLNTNIQPFIGANVKNFEMNIGAQFFIHELIKFTDYQGNKIRDSRFMSYFVCLFWSNLSYSIKLNDNFNIKPQVSCLMNLNFNFFNPTVGIGLDWKIPGK